MCTYVYIYIYIIHAAVRTRHTTVNTNWITICITRARAAIRTVTRCSPATRHAGIQILNILSTFMLQSARQPERKAQQAAAWLTCLAATADSQPASQPACSWRKSRVPIRFLLFCASREGGVVFCVCVLLHSSFGRIRNMERCSIAQAWIACSRRACSNTGPTFAKVLREKKCIFRM